MDDTTGSGASSTVHGPGDLIDIGAKLTHESFAHDLEAVLARAAAAGVSQLVVTGSGACVPRPAWIRVCPAMIPRVPT